MNGQKNKHDCKCSFEMGRDANQEMELKINFS